MIAVYHLLHRIILQSPARNSSHVWDIRIREFLMTDIVRVHTCAKILIGRKVQGWATSHEMYIRHWAELYHVTHIV